MENFCAYPTSIQAEHYVIEACGLLEIIIKWILKTFRIIAVITLGLQAYFQKAPETTRVTPSS